MECAIMNDFELIPHTADIRLRVFGRDLKELFKNALIGMFQSIGPVVSTCQRINDRLVCPALPVQHSINITAGDKDQLLIDFLNEALYLSDIHDEAYLDAEILQLDEKSIQARIKGIGVERFEVVEIKAVTHHGGPIKKIDDRWTVDVVIDI